MRRERERERTGSAYRLEVFGFDGLAGLAPAASDSRAERDGGGVFNERPAEICELLLHRVSRGITPVPRERMHGAEIFLTHPCATDHSRWFSYVSMRLRKNSCIQPKGAVRIVGNSVRPLGRFVTEKSLNYADPKP